MSNSFRIRCLGAMLMLTLPAVAVADSGGFLDQFRDPVDGQFDASNYLLENAYGFLPVPIIISEPAVDNGLGLAGAFFHPKPGAPLEPADGTFIEPNVTAVAAAVTGNDSWLVGGGHMRDWAEDTRRYVGLVGYGDINLNFYGDSNLPPLPVERIGFNVRGFFTEQELAFELQDSEWYIGPQWRYLRSEVSFDLQTGIPEIDDLAIESQVSSLGLLLEYEKVDSRFSPEEGLNFRVDYTMDRDWTGSDFDFDELTWEFRQYFSPGERWRFSWRLDGGVIDGFAPFFLLPDIDIQGIPALRYQDNAAATLELRLGYKVTPRWTLNVFAGGGRVGEDVRALLTEETQEAFGGGFRYQLARLLGLQVGIDIARGPEDTVAYLVTGSAW